MTPALQMRPPFWVVEDTANGIYGNLVSTGQRKGSCPERAGCFQYLSHLGIRQLRLCVTFPEELRDSIPAPSVSHVFKLRAQVKVAWVAALSIVAGVQYVFALWWRAERQRPSNAVGAAGHSHDVELAVPFLLRSCFPVPALVSLPAPYLFPEPFLYGAFLVPSFLRSQAALVLGTRLGLSFSGLAAFAAQQGSRFLELVHSLGMMPKRLGSVK